MKRIFLAFFFLGFIPFSVASVSNDYDPALSFVQEKGFLKNPGSASDTINRADFLELALLSADKKEEAEKCIEKIRKKGWSYVYLTDVSSTSSFSPFVCLAFEKGILKGYGDQTFRPQKNITFIEAAKILISLYDLNEKYFISSLEERGAIPISIKGLSSPLQYGEAAEIIMRLTQKITDKPTQNYQSLASYAPAPCDNCIVINKIGVQAPIVFDAGEEAYSNQNWDRLEKDLMTALQGGVAHYPYTAKPGEVGNVFITGHSSYYQNLPGNYKFIFSRLGELSVGDSYEIYYGGQKYSYRIFEEKVIRPSDTSVLDQPSDHEISTLLTCWPVWTSDKRKVFVAERVG